VRLRVGRRFFMFFLANEKIGPECVRGKAAFENRQYTPKNFGTASRG
jgi:hypothetical protein